MFYKASIAFSALYWVGVGLTGFGSISVIISGFLWVPIELNGFG